MITIRQYFSFTLVRLFVGYFTPESSKRDGLLVIVIHRLPPSPRRLTVFLTLFTLLLSISLSKFFFHYCNVIFITYFLRTTYTVHSTVPTEIDPIKIFLPLPPFLSNVIGFILVLYSFTWIVLSHFLFLIYRIHYSFL